MARRKKKQIKKPVAGTGFIMIDIKNPNFNPAHAGASGNPEYVPAMMNPKESPAAWYHHYGHITKSQYFAAIKFRRLYERTGGAGVKALDYGKEPVDGGQIAHDGLTQGRMDAAKELEFAHDKLGKAGFDLVQATCGELQWLKDMFPTKYQQGKAMNILRECLDELATVWGYQSRVKSWRAA